MEGLSTFYFSIVLFAVVSFTWFVSFCHCMLCLHIQKSLCSWMAKLETECPAMLFMLIWLLLFLSLLFSNMIWEVCNLGKDGARVCLAIRWRYQGTDLHSNEPGKIKKGEFYLWAPPGAVCHGATHDPGPTQGDEIWDWDQGRKKDCDSCTWVCLGLLDHSLPNI